MDNIAKNCWNWLQIGRENRPSLPLISVKTRSVLAGRIQKMSASRPKQTAPGIDIIVKNNTKGEKIYIPALVTHSGVKDLVYNDFYIGENADVTIVAGCGVNTDGCDGRNTTVSIASSWKRMHGLSMWKSTLVWAKAPVNASSIRRRILKQPKEVIWKWKPLKIKGCGFHQTLFQSCFTGPCKIGH